jgi:hypothetical protein
MCLFWSAGSSPLRAGSCSCSLNVLHRGLRINTSQFWTKNIDLEIWIRIRIETNLDPRHRFQL